MNLFLDDKRTPDEVIGYDSLEWVVVKDYDEFVEYILLNGLPSVISFDHDLDDEHYDIDWADVYIQGQKIDHKKPTGLDCLKWLTRYISAAPLDTWPACSSHSLNPLGKEQIEKHLETFSFPRFRSDI